MGATSGLDAHYTIFRQSLVPCKKLSIFQGVDIVGDHNHAKIISKSFAKAKSEHGFSGAYGTTDANANGPGEIVIVFSHDIKRREKAVS
jgi:hypothetical protein